MVLDFRNCSGEGRGKGPPIKPYGGINTHPPSLSRTHPYLLTFLAPNFSFDAQHHGSKEEGVEVLGIEKRACDDTPPRRVLLSSSFHEAELDRLRPWLVPPGREDARTILFPSYPPDPNVNQAVIFSRHILAGLLPPFSVFSSPS